MRREEEVESRRKIVEEMAKSAGSKRWAVGVEADVGDKIPYREE